MPHPQPVARKKDPCAGFEREEVRSVSGILTQGANKTGAAMAAPVSHADMAIA
jgi:hypothetical protein